MAISAICESLQSIWNKSQDFWQKSFFDETDASLAAKPALTPGIVPQVLPNMTAPGSHHLGLVGVLRGDVDASYLGSAASQYLDMTYFQDLSAATGLSLSQFGVYPAP